MANALLSGRKDHRANGNMALHVLEIMEKIHTSSDTHQELKLETTCDRPAPLELTDL